MPAVFL